MLILIKTKLKDQKLYTVHRSHFELTYASSPFSARFRPICAISLLFLHTQTSRSTRKTPTAISIRYQVSNAMFYMCLCLRCSPSHMCSIHPPHICAGTILSLYVLNISHWTFSLTWKIMPECTKNILREFDGPLEIEFIKCKCRCKKWILIHDISHNHFCFHRKYRKKYHCEATLKIKIQRERTKRFNVVCENNMWVNMWKVDFLICYFICT